MTPSLRLDLPLLSRSLDEREGESPFRREEGGPLPRENVNAFVSMLTPREHRLANDPSFIEFDMMHDGFGILFIPSLAPLSFSNRIDRPFPHVNVLSLSWSVDGEERLIQPSVDSIREQEWNHLCVVLSRSVIKNSQVTVCMNGSPTASHKLQYILQNVGGGASQIASTLVVNSNIGIFPSMRCRLASLFLMEEALSGDTVDRLFTPIPYYRGVYRLYLVRKDHFYQRIRSAHLLHDNNCLLFIISL